MATNGLSPEQRPLLIHGERLRRRLERFQGGGGEKFHPMTLDEAQELLLPQVQELASRVLSLSSDLRGDDRVVFQATLLPNYLAASYYPTPLLEALDLVPLGSRAAVGTLETAATERPGVQTKSLILAGRDDAISHLEGIIRTGGANRTDQRAAETIRRFSEFRLPRVDEILGKRATTTNVPQPQSLEMFEAVLHPSLSAGGPARLPASQQIFSKWQQYVERLGGEVLERYRRVVGGLTFVPVRLPPAALPSAALFNPLRAIRPMPSMRPLPLLLRGAGPRVNPPSDVTLVADLSVAVFDGGVDGSSPYYSPAVANRDLTSEPPVPDASRHGSGVVGGLLYGNIQPGTSLGRPVAHVDHYRVVPYPDPSTDPDAYWILDQVEAEVNANDFRLVNLSLGPNICVESDAEPNRWTATLDALAYEKGVLFITAAGNNGCEDASTGLNRVQVPADMVNGISVGACDVFAPGMPWNRASYSALGPGRPGAVVQPVGVQFGGDGTCVFQALQPDGSLIAWPGTSFATPLVTHGLLQLSAQLGRDRSVQNTLRAFAVHFAEQHPGRNSSLNHVGYGRLPLEYHLNCPSNEVTVLYQDAIERDEVVGLPLPIPDSVRQGSVDIKWTLVITVPTEPTESVEYTRATLEPVFRPHANKHRFSRPGETSVIVDVVQDHERVSELLAAGYQLSGEPASKSVGPTLPDEVDRREAGKWETVRRADIRMRASSLRSPRLDLTYVARQGGLLDRSLSKLEYSLLVTVRTRPDIAIYDQVRNTFQALTPLRMRAIPRLRT